MELRDVVNNIVKDTAVDLTQQFDRNFERKAFFNKKWPETRHPNSRGSLLNTSGTLRKSIKNTVSKGMIKWSSALPYASIHNEGGDIKVTDNMKRFFWAMYYKASGAVSVGKSKRNEKLKGEAGKWKAMALLKVGTILTIDQRQFIGWHPEVDKTIIRIADMNMAEFNEHLKRKLA